MPSISPDCMSWSRFTALLTARPVTLMPAFVKSRFRLGDMVRKAVDNRKEGDSQVVRGGLDRYGTQQDDQEA